MRFAIPILAVATIMGSSLGWENNEDAKLAAFFDRCLDEDFQRHPYSATRAGDHRFDDRMDDLSASARDADLAITRRVLADLPKSVSFEKLTRAGQIDFEILRHSLGVGNPCRSQPGGKTIRASVRRIFGREFECVDFEAEFRQPFFIVAGCVAKIGHWHVAEESAPAFYPHFRTQREKNIMGITFPATENRQPSAPLQHGSCATKNGLVIVHPMQRGIGKNHINRGGGKAGFQFPRIADLKLEIRKCHRWKHFPGKSDHFHRSVDAEHPPPRDGLGQFRRHFAVSAPDIQNSFVAAQI